MHPARLPAGHWASSGCIRLLAVFHAGAVGLMPLEEFAALWEPDDSPAGSSGSVGGGGGEGEGGGGGGSASAAGGAAPLGAWGAAPAGWHVPYSALHYLEVGVHDWGWG